VYELWREGIQPLCCCCCNFISVFKLVRHIWRLRHRLTFHFLLLLFQIRFGWCMDHCVTEIQHTCRVYRMGATFDRFYPVCTLLSARHWKVRVTTHLISVCPSHSPNNRPLNHLSPAIRFVGCGLAVYAPYSRALKIGWGTGGFIFEHFFNADLRGLESGDNGENDQPKSDNDFLTLIIF